MAETTDKLTDLEITLLRVARGIERWDQAMQRILDRLLVTLAEQAAEKARRR